MAQLYNVSSSPHVRTRLSTGQVMYDVILSLLPATFFGIYRFGFHAAMVAAISVVSAMLAEFIFDYIVGKPNTVKDGSAIVTGLLLALCLPGSIELYIPALGSIFAVIVVKGLFGGLGKNFMNPALGGRCFLLISFSGAVTTFKADGVSGATPLVDMSGGVSVSVWDMFLGYTNGVLGCSIAALLIGGVYLLVSQGITYEIPLATLVSFALFIALFGGRGFDPAFIAAHICGGGIVLGAFFMATDPVTTPVTSTGQLLFGCAVGIISGLFRIFGSAADSGSYAIIISNLLTPLIDEISVPKPYGYREGALEGDTGKKGLNIPKSAVILCAITLIAGLALSGVFGLTKDTIEEQQLKAQAESFKAVCPEAEEFELNEAASKAIEELAGATYGTEFGKVLINNAFEGVDASGNTVGYVLSVTSKDGFDGDISLSLGLQADGTINGIAFTELNETAGMGMRCEEPEFKDQFNGRNVPKFTLNKSGGASSDEEINSVSGASISSGAVVNAVNAALDFFENVIKEG